MPTRYREQIFVRSQGKLVVTVDRDHCLLIYPLPEWEQTESKLMSLPTLHPQSRGCSDSWWVMRTIWSSMGMGGFYSHRSCVSSRTSIGTAC